MARCLDYVSLTPEELATLTPEEYASLPVYASCSSASEQPVPASESESASAYWESGSCSPWEYHPQGRQGIGVAQPQSGTHWPLVNPSDDIRDIIADLHLSYDDPADFMQATWPFVPPFRIEWIYGLGCLPASVPVDINPQHPIDMVIVDANDEVVFDTRGDVGLYGGYSDREWGDRLHLYEWRQNTALLRLVLHTRWSPVDTPEPRDYPIFLRPDSAVLDERAVDRRPKRVRSLTVVLDSFTRKRVDFVAGYNMLLVHEDTRDDPGKRHVEEISFAAIPGEGLGVYPGCEIEPLAIKRINGIGPTDAGDFFLAATDCYWVRRPTVIVSEHPYLTAPALPNIDPNIPEDEIDPALLEPAWPTSPLEAHLQLGNDCQPCCPCDYYVEVGNYMFRVRNRYWFLGRQFEDIRDIYHENRERWLASLSCFHRRPLRLFMKAQRCPFLDVAIQFCNQSDECKTNVDLTVLFSKPGQEGIEVPGYTYISGAKLKQGRVSPEEERYKMDGEYPSFSAHWDAVQPYSSVYAKFRLDFQQCNIPLPVEACLTGTVEGEPIMVKKKPPDTGTEEAEDCKITALDCPAEDSGYDPTNCPPQPAGEEEEEGSSEGLSEGL